MRPLSIPLSTALLFLGACATPGDSDALQQDVRIEAPRLPNIVILYADDLGYGDLGCYSEDSKIPTPHLDRLAAEGLRFTDAHSSSGICTPSRYALLTGRHHWRDFHGIVNAFGKSVFAPERLTLPEMLQERGYRTACIGKWHLGWDWNAIRREDVEPIKQGRRSVFPPEAFDWSQPIPDGPNAHGFDYYFGDDVPNFPPYTWIENDRVVTVPTVNHVPTPKPAEGSAECRPGPGAEGWRLDAVMPELQRRAVVWLREQKDSEQPFFLFFPFTSPHAPIVPTEAFTGTSEAGPYGDFVAQTDATVGAVLDTLDEMGLADDTLVIFTSDNGPERYAFERTRRFDHRSMGALRGLKRDVFEGGHRVPFLVRFPGEVEAGRVSEDLIGQVDVMATLAETVGTDLPTGAGEDSFDLTALWKGSGTSGRTTMIHNTFAKAWAIRSGNWLLLEGAGHHSRMPKWFRESEGLPDKEPARTLFDLGRDPQQKNDLAAERPELVAELSALLKQQREAERSAPR